MNLWRFVLLSIFHLQFQRPVLSSELQIHADESSGSARAFACVHNTVWHQQHKTKVGGIKTFQESCVSAVLHSSNKPQRLCLGGAACLKELLSLLLLQSAWAVSPWSLPPAVHDVGSRKIPGLRLLNLGQGFTKGGVQTATQQYEVTLHHYLHHYRDVVNLSWWDLYHYKVFKNWPVILYSNRHFAAVWPWSVRLR